MIIWLDAHLSPKLATWIRQTFHVETQAILGSELELATDRAIFLAARDAGAVIMTKDLDFIDLVKDLGTPPQVIWLICGNYSNARLRELFTDALPRAMRSIEAGKPIVEIG